MTKNIILVDPCDATREVLARRLRAQGYLVEEAATPAEGANMALCAPPLALIADLWMPGISGVQLSKLLAALRARATTDLTFTMARWRPWTRPFG